MTAKEFNEKYKAYISEGRWGLEFDIPEVTTYLDSIMGDGLVHIPGFKIHQIKLKFGMARFYFECELPDLMIASIERTTELEINKLVNKTKDEE